MPPLDSSDSDQENREVVRGLREPSLREETLSCLKSVPIDSDEIGAVLFELLASGDDELNYEDLAEVISSMGARAVPELVESTKNKNARTRWCAATALGLLGSKAGEAGASGVIKLLKDNDEDIRFAASEALGRIGPVSQIIVKDASPHLLDNLRDPNHSMREAAAYVFEQFGSAAKDALPALIRAFDEEPHEGSLVRRMIIGYFERLGRAADVVVPRMVDLIEKDLNSTSSYDENDTTDIDASGAVAALRSLGAKAVVAIPVLKARLAHCTEDEQRLLTAYTLGVLDHRDNAYALKIVADSLKSEDEHVRTIATVVMKKLKCGMEKNGARVECHEVKA